jgi:thioredoxin reductase (NADPH)
MALDMGVELLQHRNVVIIGGGPAGMSAALWCAELGLTYVLLERETELGGQLLWTFNAINNYIGIKAANGRELRDKFLQNLRDPHVLLRTGVTITNVDLQSKKVVLADGTTYASDALVIATGVRRRKLGVPGEEEFENRGILHSGVASQDEVSGKVVLIVGGGDAALENAVILSRRAKMVYVVHRRRDVTARKEFFDEARISANIKFMPESRIVEVGGSEAVDFVEIVGPSGRSKLPVQNVLIRIGVLPNNALFAGQVGLDNSGFIVVNQRYETSIANVFAVGDLSAPLFLTISTAVGSGASVVKTISAYRGQH